MLASRLRRSLSPLCFPALLGFLSPFLHMHMCSVSVVPDYAALHLLRRGGRFCVFALSSGFIAGLWAHLCDHVWPCFFLRFSWVTACTRRQGDTVVAQDPWCSLIFLGFHLAFMVFLRFSIGFRVPGDLIFRLYGRLCIVTSSGLN